jgi:hypothetical protein
MGGASSTVASSGGGYSSPAAMSQATVPGTTGSYVSGMGYVPRATAAPNSSQAYSALGQALQDATKGFGGSLGSMTYPDYGSMPIPETTVPDYSAMSSTPESLFPNAARGLGPLSGTLRGYEFQSAAIPRGPRSSGFQFSQLLRAAPYAGT